MTRQKKAMDLHKHNFEALASMFTADSGIKCEYRKEYGNGSFVWFGTKDNNGKGYSISTNGYIEALDILTHVYLGYNTGATINEYMDMGSYLSKRGQMERR